MIYYFDFQFPYLVAGTGNEKLLYYDLKNSSKTVLESSDLGKNILNIMKMRNSLFLY